MILAPNHFSFMDHFFLGVSIRRKVRFMAKSQLFTRPMQWIYTHGGVFPVRRGFADEEAFITAHGILERGGTIAMYCEGGRSRTGKLSEQPRRGIGRLALESGATVVPVAIHGSSKVRNWKRLQFPKVTVLYGDPIRWDRSEDPTREQQQAVADEIFAEIRALYAELDAAAAAGVLRACASCAAPSARRKGPRRVILRDGVLAGARRSWWAGAGELGAGCGRGGARGGGAALAVDVGRGAGVRGTADVLVSTTRAFAAGVRAALDGVAGIGRSRRAAMIDGGGGSCWSLPPPGEPAGEAARAGLENMARTLSIEWARFGGAAGGDPPPETRRAPPRWRSWWRSWPRPAGEYYSGCGFALGAVGPGSAAPLGGGDPPPRRPGDGLATSRRPSEAQRGVRLPAAPTTPRPSRLRGAGSGAAGAAPARRRGPPRAGSAARPARPTRQHGGADPDRADHAVGVGLRPA